MRRDCGVFRTMDFNIKAEQLVTASPGPSKLTLAKIILAKLRLT
jgi:hypothetical protein